MKNIRAIFVFLSLVVLLCTSMALLSPPLLAQSTYGSIAGSVTDSSGAAITDAQVALTNLGTAEKRTQSTGTDGLYSFVNLFPGRYKIEVEKTGFKHFTRPEVVVEVNQSARIDATLQVGDVTQTVEVTGETPLLESETSSLGEIVDEREATELPLNGRNIFNLTFVAPSVVPQGNSYGTPVGKNPFDFGNFQVGGSFGNQSAEYLDGQPLNIGYINLPLIIPTQDSIGEFKVQYNNVGPEWGKFSGGVINFSTRSGSNEWHGSAYEFLRNKVLNANEFFANAAGIKRPPFTQNQYGATLGGPAFKDKLFFFFSWERFALRQGTVFTTTVPTLAERGLGATTNFDFSAAGLPAIFDPLTVNTTTGVRSQFPGNIIPASRINPSSLLLLNLLIPKPTNTALVNNFVKATGLGGNSDEYIPRVDYVINNKSRIFGRYS